MNFKKLLKPKNSISFVFVLFLFNFLFFSHSQVKAQGWLSGWAYRKPITIDNTANSNNLTDYQVLVTLDTQSLISAGKMQSDCRDIRFADSDGTTLISYWIESGCNTASTKIWVKVPLIPASSNKTIYLYYGNSTAFSASNGNTTFVFFDDFEDQIYSDEWEEVYTNNCCDKGAEIVSGDAQDYAFSLYGRRYNGTCTYKWRSKTTISSGKYVLGVYGKGGSPGGIPGSLTYEISSYSLEFKENEGWVKKEKTNISLGSSAHIIIHLSVSGWICALCDCGERGYTDYIYIRKTTSPEPSVILANETTPTPSPTPTPTPTPTPSPTPTPTPTPLVGGLVPCGRHTDDPTTFIDETQKCTFCHLFILGKRIADFLFKIFISFVVLFLIIAGVLIATNKIETGKAFFKISIVGAIIATVSWLVMDLFFAYLTPNTSFTSWNHALCDVAPCIVNGHCETNNGETAQNCPSDCACDLAGTCSGTEKKCNFDGNCQPDEQISGGDPQSCPDCAVCGNGVIDIGEECDGASFPQDKFGNPVSCESYGYSGGTLSCTSDCKINLSNCHD